MDQHPRVHIRQRICKCFYGGCNQQYKHPQDLKRHVATHTGKKYECDICDYSSGQKRLLKLHAAVHQNEPRMTSDKNRRKVDVLV